MTQDDFVESVCVSIGDFRELTKQRINNLIPLSILHVMSKHQWECRTKYDTKNTDTTNEYIEPPTDFDREISLWREDIDEPLEYITPEEYGRAKAESLTPYGIECFKYTVMGGLLLRNKRIYFLDPPTSVLTIKMLYSIAIDSSNVASLPDHFIPVIKAHVIYQITPPYFERAGDKYFNPSFVTAEQDFRKALGDLVSYEEGQRGRLVRAVLDHSLTDALDHYHP